MTPKFKHSMREIVLFIACFALPLSLLNMYFDINYGESFSTYCLDLGGAVLSGSYLYNRWKGKHADNEKRTRT